MTIPHGRLALALVLLAAAAGIGTMLTAGTSVPATNAGVATVSVDANALKPDECAALDLTAVVEGTTGTAASELILATAGDDTIDGGGGNDCIVAGGGNDTIAGHGGSVCIGGPGTDSFTGCSSQVQ